MAKPSSITNGSSSHISLHDPHTQISPLPSPPPHSTIHRQKLAPQVNKHSPQFWAEYAVVCCVVLLSESSRGLVIPTLSSFVSKLGGSTLILSTAVSLYSIGRLIMTTVFGYIGEAYTTRTLLQVSTLVCIVGNIIYISADIAGIAHYGLYLLLLSRAMTGCGTAVMSVARAHVAATTDIHERTTFMSYLGIVSFIGFSFSPALGGLGFESSFAGLPIASETVSTYVLAGLQILCAIAIQLVMSSVMKPNRVASHMQLRRLESSDAHTAPPLPAIQRQESYRFSSAASLVPWVYVILNLTGRGVLSISETYATLLYYQVAGEDSDHAQRVAGYWFTLFGCIGVLVNFAVPHVEKLISDVNMLKISLVSGAVGFAMLCSINGVVTYTQYIIGMILVWGISCPLNQTLAVSMLSQYLGNAKQARWMAMVTASGSLGRIICPLVSGLLIDIPLFKVYNQNAAYVFAVVLTLMSYVLTVTFLHSETESSAPSSPLADQHKSLLQHQHSYAGKYGGTTSSKV